MTAVDPEAPVVAGRLRVVPPVEIHTMALEFGAAACEEQSSVCTVSGTGLPIGYTAWLGWALAQ